MGSDVRHVRGEAQKELVKKFEVFSSNGRSRWQVWSDWITMSAIAVSNATDQSHFDEREKQYLSIAGKYTRPEMEAFTEMLALLVVALEDNPEQDFLGELYMCLGLGNDHAGQFFTPYHLCEFMSAVTTPAEEFQQKIGDRGWVAVCDPTCGAGALLVAFANECRKKGINYQTDTRYSVKRLWAARTFLWSKPQGDGVWIRRYLVYFDFRNHRAEPEFHGRGIWWTDGKTIKQWKRDWGEKAQYIMCQRPKLSAMLLAPSGPYQPYTLASHTDQFESDVRKVLKSEWMYQYDNHLNFPWEVRQWEIVNRYPMAESLVKTGWADALCSQVYDEYEHSTRINLRAETYYGVFGLNRQELAAVSQSKKSFREVDNALEWKEAGLAINGKNMAMTANIRKLSGMAKTLQERGMTRSLKYLRQQTRRATGSYNGQIALQVASDWLDYLDMAGQMKMNLNLEKVRFPLDLKRRHDDLVLERNKRRRKDALRGAASSIKKDAKELENQFHIENIYKKIRKIYEYDGAEYIIRVPDGAKAILEESRFLDHCIQRGTRYFERIAKRESYIFFMRRKADPNTPWYTLEVEPGGTVRQKRSYNNDQYADLEDAKPFIAEWQQVVQGRMTAAEIDFARQSKEIRAQEFAELKENGNIIRTGANAGKLLVDELMHDLMEVEKRVG